jgi:hypothetical protein
MTDIGLSRAEQFLEAKAAADEEFEVLWKRAPIEDDDDPGMLERLIAQVEQERVEALAMAAGITTEWAASYYRRVKRSARRLRRPGAS